jgi:hypothetical protein
MTPTRGCNNIPIENEVLMCIKVEGDNKSLGFVEILSLNYSKQYFIGEEIAHCYWGDCCWLQNEKRTGGKGKVLAEAWRDGGTSNWLWSLSGLGVSSSCTGCGIFWNLPTRVSW